MNFWRRKKREEFTANNINAGNGETGIVAVMENAQCAADSTGSTGGANRRSLRTDVNGQLNPEWTEWLMGFPAGWSELEPSAMQLFRSRHTRSSARSRKN